MTAVPDSFGKTFAKQQALLPPDEEVASARVVTMGMVINCLATRERPYPGQWVRCVDKDSVGDRVRVGYFDSFGFRVSRCWDDSRCSAFGLASSRKF